MVFRIRCGIRLGLLVFSLLFGCPGLDLGLRSVHKRVADGRSRKQGRAQRGSGDKIATPTTVQWILDKAIQVHGAAGLSQDFSLANMYAGIRTLRFADGPDEVHRTLWRETSSAAGQQNAQHDEAQSRLHRLLCPDGGRVRPCGAALRALTVDEDRKREKRMCRCPVRTWSSTPMA